MAYLPDNVIFVSHCTGAGSSKVALGTSPPISYPNRRFDNGEKVYFGVYGILAHAGDVLTWTHYYYRDGKWCEEAKYSAPLEEWSSWYSRSSVVYNSEYTTKYLTRYEYNGIPFADIYYTVGVTPDDIDVNIVESWVNPVTANKLDMIEHFMKVDGLNKEHVGSLGCTVRDESGVEYDLPLISRPIIGWGTELSSLWNHALMLIPPVAVRFSAWFEVGGEWWPLENRLADTGWIENAITESSGKLSVIATVKNTGDVNLNCKIYSDVMKKDASGTYKYVATLLSEYKTISVGDSYAVTIKHTPESSGEYMIYVNVFNTETSPLKLLDSCKKYYVVD